MALLLWTMMTSFAGAQTIPDRPWADAQLVQAEMAPYREQLHALVQRDERWRGLPGVSRSGEDRSGQGVCVEQLLRPQITEPADPTTLAIRTGRTLVRRGIEEDGVEDFYARSHVVRDDDTLAFWEGSEYTDLHVSTGVGLHLGIRVGRDTLLRLDADGRVQTLYAEATHTVDQCDCINIYYPCDAFGGTSVVHNDLEGGPTYRVLVALQWSGDEVVSATVKTLGTMSYVTTPEDWTPTPVAPCPFQPASGNRCEGRVLRTEDAWGNIRVHLLVDTEHTAHFETPLQPGDTESCTAPVHAGLDVLGLVAESRLRVEDMLGW